MVKGNGRREMVFSDVPDDLEMVGCLWSVLDDNERSTAVEEISCALLWTC